MAQKQSDLDFDVSNPTPAVGGNQVGRGHLRGQRATGQDEAVGNHSTKSGVARNYEDGRAVPPHDSSSGLDKVMRSLKWVQPGGNGARGGSASIGGQAAPHPRGSAALPTSRAKGE